MGSPLKYGHVTGDVAQCLMSEYGRHATRKRPDGMETERASFLFMFTKLVERRFVDPYDEDDH